MTKSSESFTSALSAVADAAAASLLAGASMIASRLSSRRLGPSETTSEPGAVVGDSPPVPQELDVVRLRVPVDGYPAGTTGTLSLAYSGGGVVEISDVDEGKWDEVSVDFADVEVVWSLPPGNQP